MRIFAVCVVAVPCALVALSAHTSSTSELGLRVLLAAIGGLTVLGMIWAHRAAQRQWTLRLGSTPPQSEAEPPLLLGHYRTPSPSQPTPQFNPVLSEHDRARFNRRYFNAALAAIVGFLALAAALVLIMQVPVAIAAAILAAGYVAMLHLVASQESGGMWAPTVPILGAAGVLITGGPIGLFGGLVIAPLLVGMGITEMDLSVFSDRPTRTSNDYNLHNHYDFHDHD